MIPHPRNGQSVNDVFANRTEWMLLDRSRISFDGGECDKVCNGDMVFRGLRCRAFQTLNGDVGRQVVL
jgi:hypothetical protein